jgi:general L-amino acid transport system permease protein
MGLFFIGGWWVASLQPVPTEVTVGEGAAAQVVTLEQAREDELLLPDELARYTNAPLLVRLPLRNRFKRVEVGSELTPFYVALVAGLVVYTSAFIGEIVRAGIQAVPWGQVEAARALGLSNAQTLRMIILPQALRVIIPPMGNQYLNLAKNSSLAAAIAYADTYQVGTTIMNQSGQSITGFFLVMVVYLSMSLIISFVMNFVNSRFQLVTR